MNGLAHRIREGLRWRGYLLHERGVGRTRAGRWLVDLMLLPNDLHLIRSHFRRMFGRNPRLIFSRTFNEKIQRAKLFRRRARYILYADKIAVRDFVRERIGGDALIPLLWIGTDLREAQAARIDVPFVLKVNYGQGTHIFVKDPSKFDWDAAIIKSHHWLRRHYDAFAAEWQYRWITPRFLIEKLIQGPSGGLPVDYKFFCFHGRVKYIQVDIDRQSDHTQAIFDRHWNRLDVTFSYPAYIGDVTKPLCLKRMIDSAEELSRGEPFIRIDLYDCGNLMFGEITLHPTAGLKKFNPPNWDYEFARYW